MARGGHGVSYTLGKKQWTTITHIIARSLRLEASRHLLGEAAKRPKAGSVKLVFDEEKGQKGGRVFAFGVWRRSSNDTVAARASHSASEAKMPERGFWRLT